jgi:hypothetical protein
MSANGSGMSSVGTQASEAELTHYFMDLLAAHPVGRTEKDRLRLAEYLASGILHKYGPPQEVPWCHGRAVTARRRSRVPWVAQCPKGHFTDEALETNQVIGWVCEACQKVYGAPECRLVPRVKGDPG